MFKLFQAKCTLCKTRSNQLTSYRDHLNQTLKVCPKCKEYAERRAYRKSS